MRRERRESDGRDHLVPPLDAPAPAREAELERVIHELEVHQEELRIQQNQLVDSQHALEEVRDRYAQLFDFAPIGYVVLDAHGVIHEANLAAARLFRMERAHLIGRTFTRFVANDSRSSMLEHLAQCRRGRTEVQSEVVLQISGASAIPVEILSSPASDARVSGGFHNTAIVDLTERKRVEAERESSRERERQLVHEEQLAKASSRAKDHFLAMLSHELRTPLTPILFALDAVRLRRDAVPDELGATFDLIRRNVLLETRLIDDLLDMTRISQGRMSLVPEVVDAHDVLEDVVALCHEALEQKGIAVRIEAAASEHFVRGDPARLRQVVWNFLSNSIRSTPAGGDVVLRTTNPTDGWISVAVTDSGRGIDPDVLPRIFTLFEQDDDSRRRGVGLGLGLAISKAIVELHGGRISADSEGPGHGATFTVELRTVDPSEAASAKPPPAVPEPTQRTKLLLVEDNEDSASAMATFLELRGYDVRVAGSVRRALELVHEADVLISDIALPDGTGHDLMRAIPAEKRIRGIALSGHGTAEDKRRSTAAGFDRHLVKPVEPAELLGAIEKLISH